MTSLSGGFYFCLVLVANFVLFLSASTDFDFGTLTLSTMKLLGDAHMSNGSVRLTRDLGVPYSGAGKILYSKPINFRRPGTQSLGSFSTFFSFSVMNLNPSSIGGGLAFVISPDDEYVGDAGGFLTPQFTSRPFLSRRFISPPLSRPFLSHRFTSRPFTSHPFLSHWFTSRLRNHAHQ
ncbi:hypothetical protein ACP275_04G073500 [Erythranthe tilingii]